MIGDAVAEDQRALAVSILYGDGGTYDVRLLSLHQDVLEELGATLDGLARDIDMLASVIAVVLAADVSSPADGAMHAPVAEP